MTDRIHQRPYHSQAIVNAHPEFFPGQARTRHVEQDEVLERRARERDEALDLLDYAWTQADNG